MSDEVVSSNDAHTIARLVPLWLEGAPGAVVCDDDDIPALSVFLPQSGKSMGGAAVVIPGGGYGRLALLKEGDEVAAWLASLGIHAFALRYRCGPNYRYPVPFQDACRAVRLLRSRAQAWGFSSDRIGVVGFSAGGHLAACIGTRFDEGDPDSSDAVELVSCRPDFMILGYPLISMADEYTHLESRGNLMGSQFDPTLVNQLSAERHVTTRTPPVFLFHSVTDDAVSVRNSMVFHSACIDAHVPVELHLYEAGEHGVGLAKGDPVLKTWPELCARWMANHGWIAQA